MSRQDREGRGIGVHDEERRKKDRAREEVSVKRVSCSVGRFPPMWTSNLFHGKFDGWS